LSKAGVPIAPGLRAAYEARLGKLKMTPGDGGEVGADAVDGLGVGQLWRVADGWGEWYFLERSGRYAFVAQKWPDVRAYHVTESLAAKFPKAKVHEMGMGDAAWDRELVRALDGAPVVKGDLSLVMKADLKRHYTFSVVYLATDDAAGKPELDAHGEYITKDELFDARLDYVRNASRNIFVQHGMLPGVAFKKAGEWVDLVQWPLPVDVDFTLPGQEPVKRHIPADSVWMGVMWEPWAWGPVSEGKIRGFSLGGRARRSRPD
jgi:hypothetical protein